MITQRMERPGVSMFRATTAARPAGGASRRVSPGPRTSRYRLDRIIGRGGMATVYRGVDTVLNRPVAVKLFDRQGASDEDLERYEAETLMLASLNHPCLVTLLDCGSQSVDGRPCAYLVMELVNGPDLAGSITRGPLPLEQVAQIGSDLAGALEYVHERGIAHLDVKPANVLLVPRSGGRASRAKLTDFGIATPFGLLDEEPGEFILGTAAYLSPEQVTGEPVTSASDVYSFGLVLLECLTGRTEFRGEPTDSALARIDRDPQIPVGLPRRWRDLLAAMTARVPAARPSAAELEGVFRRLLADGGEDRPRRATASDAVPIVPPGQRYDVLDVPPDRVFDRITAHAARILNVPVAVLSIADRDDVRFGSRAGAANPGTVRTLASVAAPWPRAAARLDGLHGRGVTGDADLVDALGARFSASAPLVDRSGHDIGSLCVLDFEPRGLTPSEEASLADLAEMVLHELELRLAARRVVLAVA